MRRFGQWRASLAIGAAAATLMAGALVGQAGGAGATALSGLRASTNKAQVVQGGVIKYAESASRRRITYSP